MNTAQNTKEKIVALGRYYIQKLGYHAFNYKLIASDLNIKNAAIHHYFASKEDLGLAVIEKDRQDFMSASQRMQKSTAQDKLEMLLGSYTSYFKEGQKLCVIGTFGAAYHDVPERIQMAANQYLEWVLLWMTNTFKEGLKSGEFTFTATPEVMANSWIATLPGILQVSRIRGEEYFSQMMDHLRISLKAA